MIQQSVQDVRRISRELRPEALDELDLVNALIAQCSRVAELAIYRLAREALTNAMRHSKATEATVSSSRENVALVLTLTDNGKGLDENLVDGGGLTGMRERAMLIGAGLAIDSARAAPASL